MSSDPRLPDLFERAEALSEAEREEWLARLRAEEPALAVEIVELLAADRRRGARLEAPAWAGLPLDESGAEARLPDQVGPYRLRREIGRGGMGRVYLAEQESPDFRRRVALKILDRPALRDDDVRRFREEVRILASLEHPGIARFLDGGRAPDGTWFLALEYVEGVDLVEHARRGALSADDRVRLFLDVLEAVEHAHRAGVVHRDLKPANVLVGADGRPRLLDFGISKLVDPDAPGAYATTRTESRLLTPAYASPEQFRGERASVASDVYSLGVVLYELLAGVHPHQSSSGRREDLERAVLDVDPEPPSTAARQAGSRDAERPERQPALRWSADLDAICLKALRKEPEARYPGARAFADDLHRYLAGRPVEARRGSLRYRLGRLAHRRRGELVAAAAGALALAALGYAALVQLRTSRPVAPAAEPGTSSTGADGAAPAPRPFPVPRRSTMPVEELERRFAAEPENLEAGYELASRLVRLGRTAEAAVVVGRMRQIPGAADDPLVDHTESILAINLDEQQRGLALATRALERALATGRGELVPRIRSGRARVLSDLGRHEEAQTELELSAREAEVAGDVSTLARVLNDLAITRLSAGDLAEGEELLERAYRANLSAGDGFGAGTNLHNLAGLAAARDHPELAAERYREAIEAFRAVEAPRNRAVSQGDLADILRELGRPLESRTQREEALVQLRELSDDSSMAYVLYYGAVEDLEAARLDRAEAAAGEIERLSRESGATSVLALAELVRGRVASERGALDAARAKLADAARILSDNGELDSAAEALLAAAELELVAGRPQVAAERARDVLASFRPAGESRFRYRAEAVLARVAARTGRIEEAESRGAPFATDTRERTLSSRLAARIALAEIDRAAGRLEDARRRLRSAVDLTEPAGRVVAVLCAKLALAEFDLDAGRGDVAVGAARAIAIEADRLGLLRLAADARRLASASPRAGTARDPATPGAARGPA